MYSDLFGWEGSKPQIAAFPIETASQPSCCMHPLGTVSSTAGVPHSDSTAMLPTQHQKQFPAKPWGERSALGSALCRYGLRSLQYTRYHFLARGLRDLEQCSIEEAGPTPHPTKVMLLTHDIYVYSVCSVRNSCNVFYITCTVPQLDQYCRLGEVLAPYFLSSSPRSDLIVSTPMEFRNRAVRTAWQKMWEETWKGSQVLGVVLEFL